RIAANSAPDSRERLNSSLALWPADDMQAEYLLDRLLRAGPQELPVIRDALGRHWPDLKPRLWAVLDSEAGSAAARFNAGLALAEIDPPLTPQTEERWLRQASFVSNRFLGAVRGNPSTYAPLAEILRPARSVFVNALGAVCRDRSRAEYDRLLA